MNAIDLLSIIWKSDLSDWINWDFFQAVALNSKIWMYHMDAYETDREKFRWGLHKNATSCFKQIPEAIPCIVSVVQLPTSIWQTIRVR